MAAIKPNLIVGSNLLPNSLLCVLITKAIVLKRVRLRFDRNCNKIAPHLRCCGHDVEESHCAMCQGRHVEILLGSTHQGLCDSNFPDHRTKSHDSNNNLPTTGDFIWSLETEE